MAGASLSLSVPDEDAGAVMKFFASEVDQFRLAHFEANFLGLTLPNTYPAR